MTKRNANDGTGRGASRLLPLTGATTDTSSLVDGNLGYATGMWSTVEGTINVKTIHDPAPQLIPVTAYKDNIWNIISIEAGGTVAPTDITLFWQ
jgi:hypothetical protein